MSGRESSDTERPAARAILHVHGTPSGFKCLNAAQINAAYSGKWRESRCECGTLLAYLQTRLVVTLLTTRRSVTVSTLAAIGSMCTTPTNNDTYTAKFDFNLTDRQTLFVRVATIRTITLVGPLSPDAVAPSIWYHPKGFGAWSFWTVSNNLINRFTYGLTRAAFTRQGDQTRNNIQFRFIFNPAVTTALTRVTPVHNFVDDLTYVKGNPHFPVWR
jgi:hypothetical protein